MSIVYVGPATHIHQWGERVRAPVRTIHGRHPDYLVVGPAEGSEVPGTGPTTYLPIHIDYT